jgi:hypothetical protein
VILDSNCCKKNIKLVGMEKKCYSVPEVVRDAKPVGTIVKNVNGRFYVYKMIYFYKDGSKKRKSKTGKYLGYITNEGTYITTNKTQLKLEKTCKVSADKNGENFTSDLEETHS